MSPKPLRLRLWFIGWGLLLSATAAGQTPPAATQIRLGPVGLTPGVDTEIGRDTNVFHESAAERPKGDFTATITPRVELGMGLGRARVNSRLRVGYAYFNEYPNERSLNTEHALQVDLPLNRIRPYIAHSFIHTRDRESLGVEIDARPRRVEQAATAGTEWRVTGKLSLDVMAQRYRIDFDEDARFEQTPLSYVLDRDTTRVAATVRHASTPLTTVVLSTEVQQDRFESLLDRDTDSVRITPGVEFSPSALLSGRAYAGLRRFRSRASAFPDFTGFVTSVDLTYVLLGASRVSVHAERDVAYSFRIFSPYYVLGGVRVSVMHSIAGPWDVTGHVGRLRLGYGPTTAVFEPSSETILDSVDGESETWTTYGAEIGFRPGNRMRVGFGFERHQRRSNLRAGRQYDRFRTGTSFTFTL